jgi:hypothetical protein
MIISRWYEQTTKRQHHKQLVSSIIPEVSTKAKTAYKFNEMKQPLLSIPLLADDGCKINLTKDDIVVVKDNKIILEGKRDKVSTLWMIPIKHNRKKQLLAQDLPTVPSVHAANSAYHQPTIAKLMAYLNATIGSLPVKTLCNTIYNDWLTSFPGLTVMQTYQTKYRY